MNLDFDFINMQGSKALERHNKIQNGIDNILCEKINKQNAIDAVNKNKEEVFREEVQQGAFESNGTSIIDSLLTEESIIEEQPVEDLFIDVLGECVINALNINEELIEDNRSAIMEKVSGIYEAFKEEIDLTASPVVFDLVTKCNECNNTFDIDAQNSLYEEAAKIGELVKAKVGQVIIEEREISNLEMLEEESGTGVDVRLTLFKELEIANVKDALSQYSENTKMDKDSIMLMSFYETVVDYTIMETLNTLKMLEFNKDMYNTSARRPLKEDIEIKLFK